MITFLIGQRGVGKTRLLERIAHYHSIQRALVFDLDFEISKSEGATIDDIFQTKGERYFRELEKRHLDRLVKSLEHEPSPVYIALGAGFEGDLPQNTRCLWVRRESDEGGRIFLNRPRLNPEMSAYDESLRRSAERRPRYQRLSHEELTLLEGFQEPFDAEEDYFKGQIGECGGALTVMPSVFQHEAYASEFFRTRLKWGIRYFELRDDFLTSQQIEWTLQLLPSDRVILALRNDAKLAARHHGSEILWDWPLEWAAPTTTKAPPICSLHERMQGETLKSALARLEEQGRGARILKAAPEISTFAELAEGHAWVSEDPKHRAFLPRSPEDGRWRWYRLWMKNRMALNFLREGAGSASDQPLLLEWLHNDFTTRWFAAVLGDPVEHSWTPAFHSLYFQMKGLPVFRIPVSQKQWREGALDVLKKIGLSYAAVTSPLKELAFQACASVTEQSRKFQAVNTLAWTPEGWQGTNTDESGLRELVRGLDRKKVAVWGGGGTLGPLHALLPEAKFFSARTGEMRESPEISEKLPLDWNPQVVVWATGRAQMSAAQWPPDRWTPELVVDLNYTDNSPGREYASLARASYRSGEDMFFTQASEQQLFWK